MATTPEDVAKRASVIAKAALAARRAAAHKVANPEMPDPDADNGEDPKTIMAQGLQNVLNGLAELARCSRGILVLWEQRSRISVSVAWPKVMEAVPVLDASRTWGERARQGALADQDPSTGTYLLCVPVRGAVGELGYVYLDRPHTAGTFGPWELQAAELAAAAAASVAIQSRFFKDLAGSYQRLQTINKLIRSLSSNLPTRTIYEEVLNCFVSISGAEQGAFFVAEQLRLVAAVDMHGNALRNFVPTEAILEQGRKSRRPLVTLDMPHEDPHDRRPGAKDAPQMMKGMRSVITVPLFAGERVLGLIYLTSQVAARSFSKEDETILEVLSTQTANALERAVLYQEMEVRVVERTRQLGRANEELKALNEVLDAKVQQQVATLRNAERLRRYLAPNVVEAVMRNDETLGQTSRKKLTIFFTDIRGFTALSESQEPEEVISLLTEYLNAMTSLIHHHEGTLNKFLGDGLMGFFGDPIPMADHAQRAVRMALEMQEKMVHLQNRWFSAGSHPLAIGIGINTGFVTVGNIGSETFTDYTVIGTQVNLTARIQSLAGPGEIVISHPTYAQVKDMVEVEPRGEVVVKGLHAPVMVYRVISLK
ncbi:MAG: GAF domain-containing protein [Candidatus Sericytochromatia bacterium]|nr:GAF domain-containing protein [Candidatus Sericytochromatia bacterium]